MCIYLLHRLLESLRLLLTYVRGRFTWHRWISALCVCWWDQGAVMGVCLHEKYPEVTSAASVMARPFGGYISVQYFSLHHYLRLIFFWNHCKLSLSVALPFYFQLLLVQTMSSHSGSMLILHGWRNRLRCGGRTIRLIWASRHCICGTNVSYWSVLGLWLLEMLPITEILFIWERFHHHWFTWSIFINGYIAPFPILSTFKLAVLLYMTAEKCRWWKCGS